MSCYQSFLKLINNDCLKVSFSEEEYQRITNTCSTYNSTTLYRIYCINDEHPVPYKEFYDFIKRYFYFVKCVCKHGTEFMYYIDFRKDCNYMPDSLPKDILECSKVNIK